MRVQDWQVRQRIEFYRDAYARQHRTALFQSHVVDTGLDYRGATFTVGVPTTRTVSPGKDFPFLWIGNSYPCHKLNQVALDLLNPTQLLTRWTLLSSGWEMFKGRNLGTDTPWCAVRNTAGYGGTPQLFEYAYLVDAHEQIQFQYLLTNNDGESNPEFQHLLLGFKVILS